MEPPRNRAFSEKSGKLGSTKKENSEETEINDSLSVEEDKLMPENFRRNGERMNVFKGKSDCLEREFDKGNNLRNRDVNANSNNKENS